MAYADYQFYTTEYLGTLIDGDSFPRLSLRASDYLDYLTMGKAAQDPDNIKLRKACCAIAEKYLAIEAATTAGSEGEIASESVGSHSVSYRSGAEVIAENQVQLLAITRQYLAGTKFLYRGITRPCIPPTL